MRTYFERVCLITSILDTLKIPYSTNQAYEGWQIRFPWCDGDVCCHDGTYGAKNGMVETYEFPWDDGDVTMLTPEMAAIRIISLYATTCV